MHRIISIIRLKFRHVLKTEIDLDLNDLQDTDLNEFTIVANKLCRINSAFKDVNSFVYMCSERLPCFETLV